MNIAQKNNPRHWRTQRRLRIDIQAPNGNNFPIKTFIFYSVYRAKNIFKIYCLKNNKMKSEAYIFATTEVKHCA
jgi:hypothetical protein